MTNLKENATWICLLLPNFNFLAFNVMIYGKLTRLINVKSIEVL